MGSLMHCDKCKYWSSEDKRVGTCHRYPPFVRHETPHKKDGLNQFNMVHPITADIDWCGEFDGDVNG